MGAGAGVVFLALSPWLKHWAHADATTPAAIPVTVEAP
jgi:hypothetical protein